MSAAPGHTERELQNITEGTDFLAIQRINQLMLRRESGWFGGDFGQSLVDINIPVISHEVGQWVAYPDYEIIKKFKGSYLRPGNYEIFRDSMEAHGLLEQDKAIRASVRPVSTRVLQGRDRSQSAQPRPRRISVARSA